MPPWASALSCLAALQIVAVVGVAVWMVRLDRSWRARAATEAKQADERLIQRLQDPAFVAHFQREIRQALPAKQRRPQPRPHGDRCRGNCMTCHTSVAAALTQEDGTHDRFPISDEVRTIAINYCESMLEAR